MTPEEFNTLIHEAAQRCVDGDFAGALRECVEPLHQGFLGNFIRREDRSGTAWPEHAPLTIQIHGPHPLLILSGNMIAAAAQDGAPGNITRVVDGGRELVLGIDGGVIDYAWKHQRGTRRIPRRQFLYANDETTDRAAEVFAENVENVLFGTSE